MSKTRYYDKDGAPIEKAQWAELSKDPTYCELRTYDNGSLKVVAVWLGKVVSPDNMDAEYWPLYRLDVFNFVDGKWCPDTESGDTYGSLSDLNSDFEEFLSNWTESTFEEDAKGRKVFVEADDNLAALPAEPDRNTPESTSVVIGNDGVNGAW